MRVLLLNQFFWPDTAATAQYLTDVAHALVADGHDVTAVCGSSRYGARESSAAPPARIESVRSFAFSRSAVGRMLSYASFYSGAFWRCLTVPPPDLVIVLTTPPLLSVIGAAVKALRGSRLVVWQMDVYPDVAVRLNVLTQRSWITRVLQEIAYASERRADGVIALSECMRERLLEHGVEESKIQVVELWADGHHITPMPYPPETPLKILYSGNLGLAHDIETIEGAAERTRGGQFEFVFDGTGARWNELQEFCNGRNLDNVSFGRFLQYKDLPAKLADCHIGLVTQREETLGCLVPSKVYNLLAAGRPVLFVGPEGSTITRVIERYRCGWQVGCGQVDELTGLLKHLAANLDKVKVAGKQARIAFDEHYRRELGITRFLDRLPMYQAAPYLGADESRTSIAR